MRRIETHLPAIRALITGVVAALIVCVLWTSHANSLERAASRDRFVAKMPLPPQKPAATVNAILSTTAEVPRTGGQEDIGLLNSPLQFALGMIETGINDRAVGRAGEVSRYQIMPSVWRRYSASRDYQNPALSLEVACKHWIYLHDYFKSKTHREPTEFDMYVLWNTRHGYYARKGFDPKRLHRVVFDRAQRFCNLVELAEDRMAETTGGKRA